MASNKSWHPSSWRGCPTTQILCITPWYTPPPLPFSPYFIPTKSFFTILYTMQCVLAFCVLRNYAPPMFGHEQDLAIACPHIQHALMGEGTSILQHVCGAVVLGWVGQKSHGSLFLF